MTDAKSNAERRQEPRFEVAAHQSLTVHVRRQKEDRTETVEGELLDLSQGGAKICLRTCLQFSEEMELDLAIERLALRIQATTQVCWIRPIGEKQWLVGCSFTPKIAEEVIGQLATAGVLERRCHPRHPIEFSATVRWELENQPFPVVLKDYSAGGFCMASPKSGIVGQGVLIDLNSLGESHRDLSGKVRWQMQGNGEYLIGCMLNDARDYERLRDIDQRADEVQLTQPPCPTSSAIQRWRHVMVLAASWVFVFSSSMLLGLSFPQLWHGPSDKRNSDQRGLSTVSFRDEPDARLASAPVPVSPKNPGTIESPEGSPARTPDETSPGRSSAEPLADAEAQKEDNGGVSPKTDGSPETDGPTIPPATATTIDRASVDNEQEQEQPDFGSHTGSAHETTPDTQLDLSLDQALAADAPPIEPDVDRQLREMDEATRRLRDLITALDGDKTSVRHTQGRPHAAKTSPLQTTRGKVEGSGQRKTARNSDPPIDKTKARDAARQGRRLYRVGQYPQATAAFRDAVQNDNQNALYYYLLAMSLFQKNELPEAEGILKTAIAREQQRPIKNWGSLLSRYQGQPRLWVERHRSAARASSSR